MSLQLRLGIIGLSPGNGHPYSWSAMFNGYDAILMEGCGFPVIPRYLEKQSFPDDLVKGAKVTHIWTQDPLVSQHIANATYIKNVVSNFQDLVGSVDAILLARDDAEMHFEMAKPFLDAGLPIYIDKPLALSFSEANRIIALQKYPGQIFSCSALSYAPELRLDFQQKQEVGRIRSIHAFVPNDWDKYSIHVVEPLLQLIPQRGSIVKSSVWRALDQLSVAVEYSENVHVHINTCGKSRAPLGFRIIGDDGWCDLFFTNTFRAFHNALQDFVDGVVERDIRIPPERMLDVVELIEVGRTV